MVGFDEYRGKRQCEDNWAWSNPNSIIPQSYQWEHDFFWLIIPCKVPFRIKTNYKNFYYRLLEHIFSELIRLLFLKWLTVLEMQKSSGYWKWTSIRSESADYERKQEFDFYLSKIISNSKCWYTLITKERWSLFDLVPSNTKGIMASLKAELDEGREAGRQRLIFEFLTQSPEEVLLWNLGSLGKWTTT